jgi:hypothetical protein
LILNGKIKTGPILPNTYKVVVRALVGQLKLKCTGVEDWYPQYITLQLGRQKEILRKIDI